MALWTIRIFFLILSVLGGYAVSQVRPELVESGWIGAVTGFGFGGILIAIDEMLKGFTLRAFSAATFGLILGMVVAWTLDNSGLFIWVDEETTRWLVRLCLFIAFGYIGMILATRGNKEDFTLIIPFVRFKAQSEPEEFLLLDTSAVIDGRVADLIEARFLDGIVVVPQFVLAELQALADSSDNTRRMRGRRGLDILTRLRASVHVQVKIHEADLSEETTVDAKLVRLGRILGAKLFTTDYNLARVAELHDVSCVNVIQLAAAMRTVVLPGDVLKLRVVREGKEKGQGVGYLNDGTMVVVNDGQSLIGREGEVRIHSLVQTGAGVIVFAECSPQRLAA